jgi:kinetochore protein Mis13/DSN1
LQSLLEERTADLEGELSGLSVKAKGKRRATGDLDPESKVLLLEHELSPEFRPALLLSKSMLGLHRPEDPSSGGGRRGMTRTGVDREKLEAEIQRLLPSLEFTIDELYSRTSAAKTTTDIAERVLNERFDFLNSNLASRIDPLDFGTGASGSQTTQLLSTYVTPGTTRRPGGLDPMDVMRALSRVDEERPPAQVGDAARRAVREVQRAGESGYVGGEKRLTNVPSTPRKTPGTPRRGNTPGRGSTPGR